jgi:hypothetical protein
MLAKKTAGTVDEGGVYTYRDTIGTEAILDISEAGFADAGFKDAAGTVFGGEWSANVAYGWPKLANVSDAGTYVQWEQTEVEVGSKRATPGPIEILCFQ